LLASTSTHAQNSQLEGIHLFQKIWSEDSCGKKGYRNKLLELFDKIDFNFLDYFKNKTMLIRELGNPDYVRKSENKISYYYGLSTTFDCSFDNPDNPYYFIVFIIDEKTEKIISSNNLIH